MSNPGFQYTDGGAGRYKLCSNYPYTWPDRERRRAFVQRCSYFSFASSMMIFSLSLHRMFFLYEYLRNTSKNLYADYAKIVKMHWMDGIPSLRKRQ